MKQNIHFSAWKKGIKSLYYLRSMSLQRAEVVNQDATNVKVPMKGKINVNEEPKENELDYEECLSCQ